MADFIELFFPIVEIFTPTDQKTVKIMKIVRLVLVVLLAVITAITAFMSIRRTAPGAKAVVVGNAKLKLGINIAKIILSIAIIIFTFVNLNKEEETK